MGALIKKKLKEEPTMSTRKLLKWLKDTHMFEGSKSTLHRYLQRNNYQSRVARKVFAISKTNQAKRLTIAHQMVLQDNSYFQSVIWSDETMVKARPDYRQIRYFTRPLAGESNAVLNRQVTGGGFSVMFWGCISYSAKGPLVAIEGKLNGETYSKLLEDYLLPELEVSNRELLFQQDHAPCHCAKRTLEFLDSKRVRLFPHPPQSPDLNPIERIWALMKRKLYEDFPIPTSRNQLIEHMFKIWDEFPIETIQKVIDGMKDKYSKVILAKGLWIE